MVSDPNAMRALADRLDAACEGVTEGPWEWVADARYKGLLISGQWVAGRGWEHVILHEPTDGPSQADANLIAESRSLIPDAARALREVADENERRESLGKALGASEVLSLGQLRDRMTRAERERDDALRLLAQFRAALATLANAGSQFIQGGTTTSDGTRLMGKIADARALLASDSQETEEPMKQPITLIARTIQEQDSWRRSVYQRHNGTTFEVAIPAMRAVADCGLYGPYVYDERAEAEMLLRLAGPRIPLSQEAGGSDG